MVCLCWSLISIHSELPNIHKGQQMKNSQFNLAEKAWADKILSEPSYIMPNGRKSHDVAKEVLNKAMDRMLYQNRFTADGQWR